MLKTKFDYICAWFWWNYCRKWAINPGSDKLQC